MKLGRGCELMTIIDTIPELIDIGPDSFLADGIYLGGPRIHQGAVVLAPVRLGANTYLGNDVLVAGGQTLPDNVLLGVNTVADDTKMSAGTSWFGLPPFELPKREVVACDRQRARTTPIWIRLRQPRVLGAAPASPCRWRLFGAGARLARTAGGRRKTRVSLPVLILGVVPVLDFGFIAGLCLLGLVLKWVLLGRVKPGDASALFLLVQPPLGVSLYVAWDLYTGWAGVARHQSGDAAVELVHARDGDARGPQRRPRQRLRLFDRSRHAGIRGWGHRQLPISGPYVRGSGAENRLREDSPASHASAARRCCCTEPRSARGVCVGAQRGE